MKIAIVRYGWPWRAIIAMFIVYLFGQGMCVWVARESRWSVLQIHYPAKKNNQTHGSRILGEMKLGQIRFGKNTAKVYKDGDILLIRGLDSLFFLGFLHFPALDIPMAKMSPSVDGSSYWIDCGKDGTVFFSMVDN